MKKNMSFFLVLICFSIGAVAQKSTAPKGPKFGVVNEGDFDIKITGPDSAAYAVKLFDIGTGSIQYSRLNGDVFYVFERHVRYKVINKLAYNLANLEILLYKNKDGREEALQSLHGATYNLNGKQVMVSKLDDDAKFTTRYDKRYTIKKFTLPNVKEGSIIEYTYKTKSDFLIRLKDWYFQEQYPCFYSSFTIIIPQYFSYKIFPSGYEDIKEATPVEVEMIGGDKAMKTQFFATNIPSIKEEEHMTTLDDYISKIGFELNYTEFPESPKQDYTTTWPKSIELLMNQDGFGAYLKHNDYSKTLLNDILKGETNPELKADLIFDYVKSMFKWDGHYHLFAAAKDQKRVIESKAGNSADINLLLFSLLRDAGIKAYPILISTRDNGAPPRYPTLSPFNNVIVMVETGVKTHLLDATNKFNCIDIINEQNLNHKGLKLDLPGKNAEWISTDPVDLSRSTVTYHLTLDTNLRLSGKLFLSAGKYAGHKARLNYQRAMTERDFVSAIEQSKNGLKITNYTNTNREEPHKMLEEEMDVAIVDNVESTGSLIYFTPMMYDRTIKNPFSRAERRFPVDFAYPSEQNFMMILDYPKSYQLEKLPASIRYKMTNNAGSFLIAYSKEEENQIVISSKITLAKSIFTAEEYYDLRELFNNIVAKQAEQTVFHKKNN